MDDDALAVACGQAMYARDTASQKLGIVLDEVAPGRAVVTMPVTADMINGHGIMHGGYVFLLADTAFALACNTYGQATVAAGCDIVFVAPARAGDLLTATAVEKVRTGRSGVYDVTVTDDAGAVVAELRGRSRTVKGSVIID